MNDSDSNFLPFESYCHYHAGDLPRLLEEAKQYHSNPDPKHGNGFLLCTIPLRSTDLEIYAPCRTCSAKCGILQPDGGECCNKQNIERDLRIECGLCNVSALYKVGVSARTAWFYCDGCLRIGVCATTFLLETNLLATDLHSILEGYLFGSHLSVLLHTPHIRGIDHLYERLYQQEKNIQKGIASKCSLSLHRIDSEAQEWFQRIMKHAHLATWDLEKSRDPFEKLINRFFKDERNGKYTLVCGQDGVMEWENGYQIRIVCLQNHSIKTAQAQLARFILDRMARILECLRMDVPASNYLGTIMVNEPEDIGTFRCAKELMMKNTSHSAALLSVLPHLGLGKGQYYIIVTVSNILRLKEVTTQNENGIATNHNCTWVLSFA